MYDRPWHALHRSLAHELPLRPKKPAATLFSVTHTAAMTSWLARALGEAPKMAQRRP
jgi:hypothetical protein